MRKDDTYWLVGRGRRAEAVERIYAAAADLVSRVGFEALTIEALAAKVHCSPATVYRHAGGKATILEEVAMRASARIVASVREAIADLDGTDRVVTAIVIALDRIRAEPLGRVMMGSTQPNHDRDWLTVSPGVTALAEEIIGHRDPVAAQWLLRVTLALWYWPAKDRKTECELIRRFLGPSVANAA
jgi:AcrR family transcriptional regulator